MKRPRTAQLFKNRENYWSGVEISRIKGLLPSWAFDFISVHYHEFRGVFCYSLCSPMCLVGPDGNRPAFETLSFPSEKEAIGAAKDVCRSRSNSLFVVVCI
jgi:hypothetical protein